MAEDATSIKSLLETICKKHEFQLGNYYVLKDKIVTCAGQDFYIADQNMTSFQKDSTEYVFKRGHGLPGRVWESLTHEWCPNVQKLDPSKYARRQLAIDCGVKACCGVAHIDKGVFKGVMEFFLFSQKIVCPEIIKDIVTSIQS